MKLYEDVFAEVKELIAEALAIDPSNISLESVIADLSPDSIKLFELLLMFEKKYHVETSYEDVVELNTVGDIVTYVGRVAYGNITE